MFRGKQMALQTETKTRYNVRKSVNVVDLIKEVKLQESKEKKNTLIVVAATASVLAITGIVITL